MARQKRHRRQDIRTVRTTERDRSVLEAVAKSRFATTTQLACLYFNGSRWAANKRLRKLLDAGLLRVWVRSLSEENVYTLTRRALKHVDGDGVTVPRELDGNLAHTLMLNDVRIHFALGLERLGAKLFWWRSEWELRSHGRERVIPDALFAVEQKGLVTVFALEVGNQTRYPKGLLRKVLTYRTASEIYGQKKYGVLVVGRDDRMLERYRLRVQASGLGRNSWFTSLGEVADFTQAIWKSGDGAGERSFAE